MASSKLTYFIEPLDCAKDLTNKQEARYTKGKFHERTQDTKDGEAALRRKWNAGFQSSFLHAVAVCLLYKSLHARWHNQINSLWRDTVCCCWCFDNQCQIMKLQSLFSLMQILPIACWRALILIPEDGKKIAEEFQHPDIFSVLECAQHLTDSWLELSV